MQEEIIEGRLDPTKTPRSEDENKSKIGRVA